MKEEYEEGHTPVNLRKQQPESGGKEEPLVYQSENGVREEPAGDALQEGIYKAGTHRQQGEYHETAQDYQGTYGQGVKEPVYEEPAQEPYQPVSQGFGIASLSLGIVSLVLFCTCINIPLAILAVIFGILQLVKPGCKKGMAIGGIITAVLSIFLFMVFFIGFMGSINYQEGLGNELQRRIESQLEDGYLDDYRYPEDGWDEDRDFEEPDFEDEIIDDTF